MATVLDPFSSTYVPKLWTSLLATYGRGVNYWPSGDQTQAAAVTLIWLEGVEGEEISPGMYSHALVENAALPAPPALDDAIEKDGTVYDIVRIDAYIYYFARLVLQERL